MARRKIIWKSAWESRYFRLRNDIKDMLECIEQQMYADGCNWGINAVKESPLVTALKNKPELLRTLQEVI